MLDQLVAVTQHQTLQSLSHVSATTIERAARRRWTRPRRKLLEGLVSRPPLLLPAYDAICALVVGLPTPYPQTVQPC